MSYSDLILGTGGLLGYYPLNVDATDATGGNSNLSFSTATFTDEILVGGDKGSGLTVGDDEDGLGGIFTLVQPLNLLSMELWCKSNPMADDSIQRKGILGANQGLFYDVDPRLQFLMQNADIGCNFRVKEVVEIGVSPISDFGNPTHVVMQYEPTLDATVVYVAGVIVSSIAGNGFNSLQAGALLTCGGYTAKGTGITHTGNSYVSNFAFYNRPLTQKEILKRVNGDYSDTHPATYAEIILDNPNLLGYWQLYENEKAQGGTMGDMEISGTVTFTDDKLSPSGGGSYKSISSTSYVNFMRVVNDLTTKCVETWVQIDDDSLWSAIFSLNSLMERADNGIRLNLVVDSQGNLDMLGSGVKAYPVDYFKTARYVVAQYESDIDKTVIYLDGESFYEISGDRFAILHADGRTLAGQYSYVNGSLNKSIEGNSDTSDFAVYSKALTPLEMKMRMDNQYYIDIQSSADPFGDGSLLAKYELNGDAQDTTGNFHGVASNVTYEAGKFGQCGKFNGSDSSIVVPDAFVDGNTGSYTVSSFFNLDSVLADQTVGQDIIYINPVGREFVLLVQGDNIQVVLRQGNGDYVVTAFTRVPPNVVEHAVGILDYQNRLVHLYVNAVLIQSSPWDGTFFDHASTSARIGGQDSNHYFAGTIDQVEIYNRVLTESEITDLYNQYIVPETRSLIYGLISAYNAKWSNKETFAQANWNSADLVNQMIESFNNKAVVKNNPFYADPLLDQQGNQRKFGYIASTTKINDIPVANKRVVIVANDTLQIIDETISDEFGNYRFDSLLMSRKYMITAQYGNADAKTPPEYSAVSADWQTPTEY